MSASPAPRRVAVCADDFGLTAPAVSGILALAREGRVSAVACAVLGPAFAAAAPGLRELGTSIATGLHLDLTSAPGSPGIRARVIAAALRPARARGEAAAAVPRQLDRFEAAFGRPPDFVDGHEHVHQLPGVRDALLGALEVRYGRRVAVRSTVPARYRGAKAAVVAALGGRRLAARLAADGWPRNADFAGVYDFSTSPPWEGRLAGWLAGLADGGLVMCHPEQGDGAAPARRAEFDFLASPDWPALQRREGVRLVRFAPGPFGP